MNFDDGNSYNIFMDRRISEGFGVNCLSHLCSFVDFSMHNSNHLVSSGGIALQEAFGYISKFAGALFIWISTGSNPNNGHKMSANISHGSNVKNYQVHVNRIKGLHFFSGLELESAIPLIIGKFTNSTARRLLKEFGQYQVFPVLSLAAALIPPFENLSARVLSDSIKFGTVDDRIDEFLYRQNKEEGHKVCDMCTISSQILSRDAVEPITGIKFPTILGKPLGGEVLVGIGFRSMKVIKFKSLKIYAFGLWKILV